MKTQIRFDNLKADILSGMIVALVSIPISMGYAQIAGLPPVYGLYGFLLPILCFGMLTSSPQFVVGVDAMPAVMVGNAVTAMGLSLGTPDAIALVPVISLLTGLWFLVFWLLRANRVVKYISTPVMGGFISGIGVTITMLLVLLFGTGLLRFLPVPILTGIVIAALIGIVEHKLAKRLWRTNRREFWIFMTAFAGVLLFGTIYGVMVGVALSFFSVVVRAVVPPTAFLGRIPGHEDFYDLKRNRSARPLQNTVIYRFNGNLFFDNIDTFENQLDVAIKPDTKQVIVDAAGIGNIDLTACDRLAAYEQSLRNRGIRLYLTGHVGSLNDQLRKLGAGKLMENGTVRKTIDLALRDCNMAAPYTLEGGNTAAGRESRDESESYAEFEWLYGEDADQHFDTLAHEKSDDDCQGSRTAQQLGENRPL